QAGLKMRDVAGDLGARGEVVEIVPGTKAAAGSRQQDAADLVELQPVEMRRELAEGLDAERVELVGPVEGQRAKAVRDGAENQFAHVAPLTSITTLPSASPSI